MSSRKKSKKSKKPSDLNTIDPDRIHNFHSFLFKWYSKNKRDLPWRDSVNPYHILLSEFMLQQTQVNRVIPKYKLFISSYPTIYQLAFTNKQKILDLWLGLGYNKRAIWLKEAAMQVYHMGFFPNTPEELIKFKGIGPYTSRSIPIFAFNANYATVDTNIRRILIHEGFATEKHNQKELFKIAELLLPEGRSRDYHNALMDYGSLVLTANKTNIRSKNSKNSKSTNSRKFKDSNRKYRGDIVKFLINENRSTREELYEILQIDKNRLDEIINSLIKDELIKERDDTLLI